MSYHPSDNRYGPFDPFADANTVGSISGEQNSMGSLRLAPISPCSAIASIDWGCAVQIAAAAAIGSGEKSSATTAETLYVLASSVYPPVLKHDQWNLCRRGHNSRGRV